MEHKAGAGAAPAKQSGRSYFLPPLLYRARLESQAMRRQLTLAANRVKARSNGIVFRCAAF
jgi:hypothetical protein